tara:strand:+ start:2101 stop:2514 length:414 start_codon:yes stop_codon:yes gene_type:complete
MAQELTTSFIVELFEEAISTDKKLPPAYKKGYSHMKFDVKHEATEHAAWDKREMRVAASSKEIARYEFILFNINPLLSKTERKLMWSRALRVPYHYLGKKLKMHRHTVKEKYIETIIYIKYLIAYDKKLLDKFDKIK